MADAKEARYLLELRDSLGSIDWWVWPIGKQEQRRRFTHPTRLQALIEGGRRFGFGIEKIDAEAVRE